MWELNRNILEAENTENGGRKIYSVFFILWLCQWKLALCIMYGLVQDLIVPLLWKRILKLYYYIEYTHCNQIVVDLALHAQCVWWTGIEDTEHFLLHCSRTQDVRELFITNLRAILSDINREVENIVFSDKAMLLKVILMFLVRTYTDCITYWLTDIVMKKIEAISRELIYALHHRRCDKENTYWYYGLQCLAPFSTIFLFQKHTLEKLCKIYTRYKNCLFSRLCYNTVSVYIYVYPFCIVIVCMSSLYHCNYMVCENKDGW